MSIKTKYIFTILVEAAFIVIIGVLLNSFSLSIIANLISFILLLIEVLFISKLSYKHFNGKLTAVAVLSFVLLGISLYSTVIIKEFIIIPQTIIATYQFLMGYLALNACIAVSKTTDNKQISKIFKTIAVVMFWISITTGFLTLFSIAK